MLLQFPFSTLPGIGLGVPLQTGCAYFVVYFDKRLALANGVSSAATGVGFLTLPPLMEIMIGHYGWRGALQITSAIMANICVCGVLLKNPPRRSKEFKKSNLKYSFKNLEIKDEEDETPNSFIEEVAKSFDLSLFRNIRFILQGIVNGLLFGGTITATMHLVPYAVSVGVPDLQASLLMLVFGISSAAIRLCPVGWFVDKKYISASSLGGLAFLACGLTIVTTSFITKFTTLAATSVVYGVSVGIGTFLRYVVVTHAAGSKDKATGAISWVLLNEGVGSFVYILMIGKF